MLLNISSRVLAVGQVFKTVQLCKINMEGAVQYHKDESLILVCLKITNNHESNLINLQALLGLAYNRPSVSPLVSLSSPLAISANGISSKSG